MLADPLELQVSLDLPDTVGYFTAEQLTGVLGVLSARYGTGSEIQILPDPHEFVKRVLQLTGGKARFQASA